MQPRVNESCSPSPEAQLDSRRCRRRASAAVIEFVTTGSGVRGAARRRLLASSATLARSADLSRCSFARGRLLPCTLLPSRHYPRSTHGFAPEHTLWHLARERSPRGFARLCWRGAARGPVELPGLVQGVLQRAARGRRGPWRTRVEDKAEAAYARSGRFGRRKKRGLGSR